MKHFACIGVVAALLCCSLSRASAGDLDIGHDERLLVVAPHPDDETLAAGGLMQRVLARGGRVQVVLMTAGDGYREAVAADAHQNNPDAAQFIAYGERRLAEMRAAMNVLGNGRIPIDVIGFPDGGLTPMLGDHWWRIAPERSAFTQADRPPYAQAIDPLLPYSGVYLRDTLVSILKSFRPTIIAFPDWVDIHPDHSATGTFVMLAVDEWAGARARQRAAVPRLLAYLVHWDNWPTRPTGWKGPAFPDLSHATVLQLPADLPPRSLSMHSLTLSDQEILTKGQALSQHDSQRRTNAYQLGVFVRRTEPFTVITARELPRVQQAIKPAPFRRDGTPRG